MKMNSTRFYEKFYFFVFAPAYERKLI